MQDVLPLSRSFAIEAHSRAISNCTELGTLREVAQSLLNAWQLQAMFSDMDGDQALGVKSPCHFRPDASCFSILSFEQQEEQPLVHFKLRHFGTGLDHSPTREFQPGVPLPGNNRRVSLNPTPSARVHCRWRQARFLAPISALWQGIAATDQLLHHWMGQAATISAQGPEPDLAPCERLDAAACQRLVPLQLSRREAPRVEAGWLPSPGRLERLVRR